MAPRTSTWSPAPSFSPTLHSRRHSPRPTQTTPTRSLSPSTIHEAPTLTTSPAHQSPPTAAPPSPASPTPAVKAHSPTPLAIPLFCTTNQPAPGSRSGSTATPPAPSADTSPPLPRTRIAGEPISAFTTTQPSKTTGSLVGLTTIPRLPTSETCTSPGTTLIL